LKIEEEMQYFIPHEQSFNEEQRKSFYEDFPPKANEIEDKDSWIEAVIFNEQNKDESSRITLFKDFKLKNAKNWSETLFLN